LGGRLSNRSGASGAVELAQEGVVRAAGPTRRPPRARDEGEPSRPPMSGRPQRTESTFLVRGSSRRIMTMKAGLARSSNIRLINRRHSSRRPPGRSSSTRTEAEPHRGT
jgi:hypothetical protein